MNQQKETWLNEFNFWQQWVDRLGFDCVETKHINSLKGLKKTKPHSFDE